MKIAELAKAFAKGKTGKCHNAEVKVIGGSNYYFLHGNLIAFKYHSDNDYKFSWCGWYGPTTANHLNNIFKALDTDYRVSYAKHRDIGIYNFQLGD